MTRLAWASTLEQLAYTLDPAGNVTDLQNQLRARWR